VFSFQYSQLGQTTVSPPRGFRKTGPRSLMMRSLRINVK
jgi:hypothetical protein